MRMPRPGPGKGCRKTEASGRPMATPSSRTSSLKSSRSGSMSFRRMLSIRPPTLWCDLMVAEGPLNDTDSITSGYSVPCSRKSTLPISAASSSNTSMKLAPMILRFFSGSSTPASAARKRSDASTTRRFTPHSSRRRLRQSAASSCRSSPLSTITAWKRSPMARLSSTAATVESTPPDTAPSTLPSGPTTLRIASTSRSRNDAMFHVCGHLHMPSTKLESSVRPQGVWLTSG
mmetsp:Transcript_20478/g.72414  ORF Transcript_20478/g.72414 Transcript_20478/m.72414 type:complete len:232 (+) Transcript_20478:382-1077(+)